MSSSTPREGFRLEELSVYNWGTFDRRVWTLRLGGESGLLTGDIGSGKSTLVDALTTLLVPPQRLAYNKAAGAEARERNLRSYVLGYYKSERGDAGHGSRPVALRDASAYSVVLCRFRAGALAQEVTLAQVFWTKDLEGQPARFFVVADAALSVREHFSGFGTNIADLKKRLRRVPGVEVHDSFPPYGATFRRLVGIETEQALDLFHQAVSMKSVGSLTDFVRQHMLPPFAVEPRIEALTAHFDDLNRAHEAVLKAKSQIERLEPLVADCERLLSIETEATHRRSCRDALHGWFSGIKAGLLAKRVEVLDAEIGRAGAAIEHAEKHERELRAARDDVKQAIATSGGDRLERLRAEIDQKKGERDERKGWAERYGSLARALGLPLATDTEAFTANRAALDEIRRKAAEEVAKSQNALVDEGVALRTLRDQHDEITSEIASLRKRRSNIPSHVIAIRARLCGDLGVVEERLPFAGELLEVREDARAWEGAIERVLHGFALSMLVPEAHYEGVSAWIDRIHLGGRLVYYRIADRARADRVQSGPNDISRKLKVKPDAEVFSWLESELARRFDYVCTESLEAFRQARRALTKSGQVKGGDERHEKDDRYRIDDRSRYVLGWSNLEKIAALETRAGALEERMRAIATKIAAIDAERGKLADTQERAQQLAVIETFRTIDWKPLASEIAVLQEECARIEQGSDVLRILEAKLNDLDKQLATVDGQLRDHRGDRERAAVRRDDFAKQFEECTARSRAVADDVRASCFPRLEELRRERLSDRRLTVESCDNAERELRDHLQTSIDALDKQAGRLREAIVAGMEAYRRTFPLDTQDVDATVRSAPEYAAMLERLRGDDLPRFEGRFKELLNENTIREVASFQSQLHRERQTIRDRIDVINRSLKTLDYNLDRYIALEALPSPDVEIRDFQQELRVCTEGTLGVAEDEVYSETKFLQVKRIIERFRGRAGTSELDMRWTRKVTDVRNWYVFAAVERWRSDDSEHEHYADTGGKSGGQKEKLAYTVLAAGLAYQLGIEPGTTRPRSFRCVVIDEAFGRGSDESARYGLQLFEKLRLQLLIVTPLQKIHVIEPYVAAVGFVHNEEGRRSMLRNLTIEEYRAERAARLA